MPGIWMSVNTTLISEFVFEDGYGFGGVGGFKRLVALRLECLGQVEPH